MLYSDLFSAYKWKRITNCPGRFVLDPADQKRFNLFFKTLPGIHEYRVQNAADPVLVCSLDDGGFISFRHDDGFYVHTLNNSEGFLRKLNQLGIKPQ